MALYDEDGGGDEDDEDDKGVEVVVRMGEVG